MAAARSSDWDDDEGGDEDEGEPRVRPEVLKKLGQALGLVDRPGTFCSSGSVPAVLPGLEVPDFGPVGLPLGATQARELIKHCEQAPYGKGEKTLVDKKVRRVWRMKPDRFSIKNPEWVRLIAGIVGKVQDELGLEERKLEAHLYDLLVYEPGGFFLPHKDGEKLDRMVATLVVVLPSSYEGGELIVRHDGQERTIDFQADENSAFQVHFAAFYADCEHEVRPLKQGYRLALVYNLTVAKSKKAITAPRASEHIERIAPLVDEWAKDEAAEKLVITLGHQYTKDGIAWDSLKGADRVKASVLREAARRAGCRAYLALLTFHESGSAEYAGGRRSRSRRRWDGDYGDDPDDYEMGEIYESSLTADRLVDAEGEPLPIGELDIDEQDLLAPESLRAIEPEEDFEGYTGNAGMTIDRWYRHAAVILWPEARHFEILCDRDSRLVVPVLGRMVDDWRRSKAKDSGPLKVRCVALASAILAGWRASPRGWSEPGAAEKDGLLASLAALDEPALISRYLGEVMIKDGAIEPGKSLPALCEKYGWGTFRAELRSVIAGTTDANMGRNARMLEQICSARPRKKEGWADLAGTLARDLVSAIEATDAKPPSTNWYARQKTDRAEVLAELVLSLLVTGQEDGLSRLVDHAKGSTTFYPLKPVQLSALELLRPGFKKHLKEKSEAVARWVASCREQLEALTAQRPQPPADYRREAPFNSKDPDLVELKRFLENPTEAEHRFSVRQDRRDRLESTIKGHNCDLDFTTERTRSPHTLVCTKNTASYEARLKTYHDDLGHLDAVRSLEASLPK